MRPRFPKCHIALVLAGTLMLAAACARPFPRGQLGVAPAAEPSSVAIVAIKATPVASIANLGILAGRVLGPRAEIVANNAASILSNNAGSFTSKVKSGGGLISDKGSAVIANNGGGVISNHGASYRLAGEAEDLVPVAGARVEVLDEAGAPLSDAPATTTADGGFTFAAIRPSGASVFLRVTYETGGHALTLAAIAAAPRDARIDVRVTPATTFVAKKVDQLLLAGSVQPAALRPEALAKAATALANELSSTGQVAAALLPPATAARAFDTVLKEAEAAKTEVTAIAETAELGSLVTASPEGGSAPAPFSKPVAASAQPTASAAPSAAPTTATTPVATARPLTAPDQATASKAPAEPVVEASKAPVVAESENPSDDEPPVNDDTPATPTPVATPEPTPTPTPRATATPNPAPVEAGDQPDAT